MAEDNKKLLQTAKKNLDALGDALGKKIGAAIENQDAGNVTSNLEAVKKSFTKPVIRYTDGGLLLCRKDRNKLVF